MERVSEVVRVESKSRRRLIRSGVVGGRRNVDVNICVVKAGLGLERRMSRVSAE